MSFSLISVLSRYPTEPSVPSILNQTFSLRLPPLQHSGELTSATTDADVSVHDSFQRSGLKQSGFTQAPPLRCRPHLSLLRCLFLKGKFLALLLTSLISSGCCVSHGISEVFIRPVAETLQPQTVFRIEGLRPEQKIVALTIDDAPSRHTGKILDVLKKHRITATFFVHGDRIETAADKSIIRRMLHEGHEVANHMPESIPSASLAPSIFARQFMRNHRILEKLGVHPTRFRPSHGISNRDMRSFMNTIGRDLSYKPSFYLASVYSWDIHIDGPLLYAHDTAACAKPGRIVVFHDNQDVMDSKGVVIDQSQRTLDALPTFFELLEQQGFTAKSIAEVEALVTP
jgi:peptidoglycan/xylan/chitin deacetylase (PgdA/CDA1 family)